MSYTLLWRNKYLTADATTITEMVERLQEGVNQLKALAAKGVTLDAESDMPGDFAFLQTDDPAVAQEFDFDAPEENDDQGEADSEDLANDDAFLSCTAVS